MTQEEYDLINEKNEYFYFAGRMGEVFNNWRNDKIDGNKAVLELKGWYDKGLEELENEKIENEKRVDIQQKELKRHFDSLDSYIRKYSLVDLVDEEKPALPDSTSLFVIKQIVLNFPKFNEDYPILKENGYLLETEQGLQWQKSKQSLAEYFHSIAPANKNMSWKLLEAIFNKSDLKNSLSRNGSEFKKTSKDFEQWEKIKNTPKGK
jgi:hypothetical protein